MNASEFIEGRQPPNWLKILVICLLVLTIFFRITHPGQRIYWYDEAFTSLAISGHTLDEVKQEVFHRGIVNISVLDKYQQINTDRGVADTVNYLVTSDPQHPPLYYSMVRLWAQIFGDSIGGVRSLSAVISLLIFPGVYWLCLELFSAPIVAWVALLLMAVSPFELFFAQEARQYCLWMVTILLSTAALLRAMRRDTKVSWALYTLTLTLGFYTHLLSVLVAFSHGIYVAIRQKFRFQRTSINYLVSATISLLLFLPWLIVLVSKLNTALKLTTRWPVELNYIEKIFIFLGRTTQLFFDINLFSDAWMIPGFSLENSWLYYIVTAIFSLILIIYLIYFYIIFKSEKTLIISLIGGVYIFTWLFYDLIFEKSYILNLRYQIPFYLSLQIAVSCVLVYYAFLDKTWRKKIGRLLLIGLIVGGLVSDITMFKADTWWIQMRSTKVKEISQLINNSENPLLVKYQLWILNNYLRLKEFPTVYHCYHLPVKDSLNY
ncbi:MAG: glycosyltransferase family 39 protein [Cyanobacteria bacterium J06635_10]